MNKMNITEAQYQNPLNLGVSSIKIIADGIEIFVPLDPANTHYAEIMRQVEAGELTIADAE